MGPFQTIHLNAPEGIAGYVDRYEKMYQGMFDNLDIEWSSVIKLGLEQELLKLYDLGEREKYEKQRDNKLQNLFYIKQRLNSRKCSILYFKKYFLNNSTK